jgi:hypothetical protein
MDNYDFSKAKIYMDDKEVGFIEDIHFKDRMAIADKELTEKVFREKEDIKGFSFGGCLPSEFAEKVCSSLGYRSGLQADRVAASQNSKRFRQCILGSGGKRKLKSWQ